LHQFHEGLDARFGVVNDSEVVNDYGAPLAEHAALNGVAGIIDLSFRSRLCVTGADRARFLHGQVTNSVQDLQPGQGCYAALVTAKGRMESDLNVHCLPEELLLDFEPGLGGRISDRLERFSVADDVQIVDVMPHYGFLCVVGPKADRVMAAMGLDIPAEPMGSVTIHDAEAGEILVVNRPWGKIAGLDLFVPTLALESVAGRAIVAAKALSGCACGWEALEAIRIEAGLPRFGIDMDETNLAPETGIEARAIRYDKGCYIGQEVINKLHTFAHVTKSLKGMRLENQLPALPARGQKLYCDGKEAGYVTSAIASPAFARNIALGYVRREFDTPGTRLAFQSAGGESEATIVPLPFDKASL
jgi:folate-binding protein YgfZ